MDEKRETLIRLAAERLLFDLSEEECRILSKEAAELEDSMEEAAKIEGLDDYEPMFFPFECESAALREDEPVTPLSVEEALSNAGETVEGMIRVPKVVER